MVSRLLALSAVAAAIPAALANPIAPSQFDRRAVSAVFKADSENGLQSANDYFNSKWVMAANAKCAGQSCHIADLAGTTGRTPTVRPEGGGDSSYKCIAKYNPAGIEAVKNAPKVEKQNTGFSSVALGAANSVGSLFGYRPTDKGTFRGRCAQNIVIFAKGTTEVGELGITVGPALSAGLMGGAWTVVGVNYDADIAGDYCLGLPGGMVARDMVNQAAQKCPDSKLYLSGYSQGGMVAHIGLAYADESAKAKVAGLVVFGDPFQGAPVKGWKGPIVTYCLTGDYVCTGNFEISLAHLSYVGASTSQALGEFKKLSTQFPAGGYVTKESSDTPKPSKGSAKGTAKSGKSGKGSS